MREESKFKEKTAGEPNLKGPQVGSSTAQRSASPLKLTRGGLQAVGTLPCKHNGLGER